MKGGLMKRELSAEQLAELEALAALPDHQIQTDDMPEVTDWSDGKRGLFYRPIKKQITLRLDADLIDWFKRHHAEDEGYQTRINSALREYVRQQNKSK
ncbi:MAG: BrnA antitoxin family protein [Cyanobacteriota bacterium ELA615]